MNIDALLKRLVELDGSDLYLSTGAPPSAKIAGELTALSEHCYARGEVEAIARELMSSEQNTEFDHELEMNLALAPEGIGRFRLNIFKQRNEVSIVARNIKTDIPRFEDLGLPAILKDVITAKNGLVLFVGGTGSGKSTSLAALIDYRNSFKGGHIITIEDPVEYIHPHKKCIVNQREVGVDTTSFHAALKNTLRQAPDVILIGEIRDRETMEHAMAFAETGHLAISTLHANNANQALDRIVNFFPEERKAQLLNDLGNNIRAIVSQRLIPTVDGNRCAAIEILLGSHTIKQLIVKDQLLDIKEAMKKSENQGMKTFDSALYDLVSEGRITTDEAIKHADSANNLRLRFKLSKPIDEDDPTELLMRGRLPSQVAAANALAASKKEQVDAAKKKQLAMKAAQEAMAKLAAMREKREQNKSPAASSTPTSVTPARTPAPIAQASVDKDTQASTDADIHSLMAARIAEHKSANQSSGARQCGEKPNSPGLSAAAAAFELALEEHKHPAENDSEPMTSDGLPKYGMGRIGRV